LSRDRLARQGSGNDVALDIGTIAAAGERCIDKVTMVQETEYDDVIECKHSYSQRCHTTYTTDYQPQQARMKKKGLKINVLAQVIENCSQITLGLSF
jgi:hypothetical protein